MNFGRRNKVRVEGGMSSMTDLVFLMLIFFIIMSTMSQQALPVDLPSGEGVTGENPPLNVGVTEDNKYFLGEDTDVFYSFDELKPILEQKMENSVDKGIKISGDKSADYEYVFNLIALSKNNGWKPVLVFK